MKISLKLFLLTTIITLISFAGFGLFSYQRDFNQFILDMKNDALSLGNALSLGIESSLNKRNFPEILDFIDRANKMDNQIKTRWVWINDQTDKKFRPIIDSNKILNAKADSRSFIDLKENMNLYTYYLIDKIAPIGGLELYEDLSSVTAKFIQNNVIHLGLMGLILLALNSLMIAVGGFYIFTKRVGHIVHFIDNIDLEKEKSILRPRGKDELTRIMAKLNQMCSQLYTYRDELIRQKDEKIKLMDQLNHRDRLALIGQLSSGIAHELGTPLNVISGRGKLIQSGQLSANENEENATIIINQCNHITAIMHNLLGFARRKPIQKDRNSLHHVIEHTILMTQPRAEKKQIEILYHQPEKKIFLNIDKVQIQQVLSNLILNSIQAISQEGKIELSVDDNYIIQNKRYVRIIIKDNGKGIPENDLEHIFKPFYTTKDVGKGTGLGLSIVYNIIKEHDGIIKVENNKGKGCRFIIFLPYEN